MTVVHVDIETYCSTNLVDSGVHRYVNSPDFEILIISYAIESDGNITEHITIDKSMLRNFKTLNDLLRWAVNNQEYLFNSTPEELDEYFGFEEVQALNFVAFMLDEDVTLAAHNAAFERNCFIASGVKTEAKRWICTAVLAASAGLPLSLAGVSKALKLGESGKDDKGKDLIQIFSVPQKPTKARPFTRATHENDPENWQHFVEYCYRDVIAEIEICKRLNGVVMLQIERDLYALDQKINDRGVRVDLDLARAAVKVNAHYQKRYQKELIEMTGLEKPKSPKKFKAWLEDKLDITLSSTDKESLNAVLAELEKSRVNITLSEDQKNLLKSIEASFDPGTDWSNVTLDELYFLDFFDSLLFPLGISVPQFEQCSGYIHTLVEFKEPNGTRSADMSLEHLIAILDGDCCFMFPEAQEVHDVIKTRMQTTKTSIAKFDAILKCYDEADERTRGLFQFYGAGRTGRWSGRRVQLQNLKKNFLNYEKLSQARELVKDLDFAGLEAAYENPLDTLSQLIRTAFISEEGNILAVSDFAAIEARVIAWLANVPWRMEVFNTHGNIYEASAAMMFNVDINTIVKGHENYSLRAKGKVAELALGYQGGVGAMVNMGGEREGLTHTDMQNIVNLFRERNPEIKQLWYDLGAAAVRVVETGEPLRLSRFKGLTLRREQNSLTIQLPSGRKLYYRQPRLVTNQYGKRAVEYRGLDDKGNWVAISTYGGKLTENVVQAIARDALAEAMLRLDKAGFDLVMHVHDELIAEIPVVGAKERLKEMAAIMGEPLSWAKGLPLPSEGYTTDFYLKD